MGIVNENILRDATDLLDKKICKLGDKFNNLLPPDILEGLLAATTVSSGNPFVTLSDLTSVDIGTNIYIVSTYDDLPDPNVFSGDCYWVENNQGIAWLPGNLGGTYHPKGLYYSNSLSWITVDSPINAPQSEVNLGLNDNKFVTPAGLKNSTQWDSKANIIHQHVKADITDFAHNHNDIYYTETETDSLLNNKVDKISGKQLSTEDFTTSEKSKLASITELFTTSLKTAYDTAYGWVFANGTNVVNHLTRTDNPHSVTKTQIGLENVPNIDLSNAVTANTAKNSYPSGDSTKVNHISVTQAVNLDTIKSDTATNNAKVGITPTQASDITTNNAKISFDSTSSTRLANTSGTNSGDNTTNTLYSGLVSNATHTGDVTGSTALTIVDNAVITAKIADNAVTNVKIAGVGTRDATTFYRGDGVFAAPGGGFIITSVDVNFGAFGYSAFIDIIDATVTISTKLMVSLVGAASGRDFDELEFSPIILSYVINAGVGFKIYAVAPNGADGIFTINYTK